MKKIIALLLIAPFLCAWEFPKIPPIPREIIDRLQIPKDDDETIEEGTYEFIAIGGVLGGILGAIAGDDSKSIAKGAILGAAATGFAGNWYLKQQVKRNKKLKGKENELRARIDYIKGVNKDAEKYNDDLEAQIKTSKKNINKLRKEIENGRASQKELHKEQKKIAKQLEEAQINETILAEQVAEIKEYRKSQAIENGELRVEVEKIEKTLVMVRANINEMSKQKV